MCGQQQQQQQLLQAHLGFTMAYYVEEGTKRGGYCKHSCRAWLEYNVLLPLWQQYLFGT
jgi:hypothetical protein